MNSILPASRSTSLHSLRDSLVAGLGIRQLLLAVLLTCLTCVSDGVAAIPGDDSVDVTVTFGFDGHLKLGCWQPFLVKTPAQIQPQRFELTVLDGDDARITYRGPLRLIGSDLNQHQGYLKLGRGYGTANLKLFDSDEVLVAEKVVSLGQSADPEILESTRQVILTLEPSNALAQTVKSIGIKAERDQAAIVISVGSAEQLPLDGFCYEGIDTVFLVTSDLERIEKIAVAQWEALERWVENGGRLIFSVAQNGEKLLATNGSLNRFCPGEFAGTGLLAANSRLESFAGTDQLVDYDGQPITVAKIGKTVGQVILKQDQLPLVIRTGKGFGEIVMVTFDLDSASIKQWKGYSNLIHRLQNQVDHQEAAQAQVASSRGGSVSHFGYEDLIGQLRVPLDRFRGVQFLAFNWIALLIGLYILCIGPGDYFFLRKITGKMELTWITFPLVSLSFCGLAIWISKVTRPPEIQLNQLEIIDVDASSNLVRGTVWSNLYSPAAGKCRISLSNKNALGWEIQSDQLSWHGLPGSGLGGMQTKSSPGIARSGYQHSRQLLPGQPQTDRSELLELPLYVSATKPLFVEYFTTFPSTIRSNLRLSLRTSRLDGTLLNPLDQRLKNCRLFFENYAYELDKTHLEPGEAIDVMTEMKERATRSLLTRRSNFVNEEKKSQNSPWEQSDTRISRIAEMLMFYEAAGGSNYTGLTHSYQGFIDLSEQLKLGRAILVGEIDVPTTPLLIDGQSAATHYDQMATIVRIVLPVTYEER